MRRQYKSEQFSVAKLAPRLTYKSCWPSALVRQNVSLALRIFDDSNVAALTIHQSHLDQKLTPQTLTSFRHSCLTLPKLYEYLTGDCGFSYVLSSFVQNDPIEHHFGLYRQMSGSNYNVSVCQELESERTLKLSNILKLYKRQTIIRKDRAFFKEFLNTFVIGQVNPTENNRPWLLLLVMQPFQR